MIKTFVIMYIAPVAEVTDCHKFVIVNKFCGQLYPRKLNTQKKLFKNKVHVCSYVIYVRM